MHVIGAAPADQSARAPAQQKDEGRLAHSVRAVEQDHRIDRERHRRDPQQPVRHTTIAADEIDLHHGPDGADAGEPEEVALHSRRLQLLAALWVVTVALAIYLK